MKKIKILNIKCINKILKLFKKTTKIIFFLKRNFILQAKIKWFWFLEKFYYIIITRIIILINKMEIINFK